MPVAGLMKTFHCSNLSCRFVLPIPTGMHKVYYGRSTLSDVSHIICRYEKSRSIVTAAFN